MVRALLAASVLAVGAYAQAAAGGPKINTPSSLITCQPSKLTWSGGSPPYFVSVIPGGDPSGAALEDFGKVDGTEHTWTVNVPAGTSVSLKVKDSAGNENYAEKVTVSAGSDTSCVNGDAAAGGAATGGDASASPAPGGAGAGAGSSGAANSGSSPSASGGAGSGGAGSGGSSSGGASAPAASSPAPGSAASPRFVLSTAVLGVAGVVAAALF